MSTEPLPPWPDRAEYETPSPYGPTWTAAALADFHVASADATLARLRVAVEALKQYAAYPRIGLNASQALAAIGDLP